MPVRSLVLLLALPFPAVAAPTVTLRVNGIGSYQPLTVSSGLRDVFVIDDKLEVQTAGTATCDLGIYRLFTGGTSGSYTFGSGDADTTWTLTCSDGTGTTATTIWLGKELHPKLWLDNRSPESLITELRGQRHPHEVLQSGETAEVVVAEGVADVLVESEQ